MQSRHASGAASLRLSILLCSLFVSFTGAGCSQKSGNRQAVTTEASAPSVTVLIYLDKSGSIATFPDGGVAGIQKAYEYISAAWLGPITIKYNGINVEGREFVGTQATLFIKTIDSRNEIMPVLVREIKKPPISSAVESSTIFANLLCNLRDNLQAHPERDFYVLVLTDGGYDDPKLGDIKQEAEKVAACANLKSVLVAPVEQGYTIKRFRRDDLTTALSPLGGRARIANKADYSSAVKDLDTMLKAH